MPIRAAVLLCIAASAAYAGWNPELAAKYLDARQKEWVAWPAANASGVPCISCHTGLSYLLARPALRHALGETTRTSYEETLLNGVKSRVAQSDAKDLYPTQSGLHAQQSIGVEAVLSAFLLANENEGKTLTPAAEKALARMWALQLREGTLKGAWNWYALDLDPWENTASAFYGASLAALAAGADPQYLKRPEIHENIAALTAYLRREQTSQPLHNRLTLLWASTRLSGLLTDAERRSIVDEALRTQNPDGGWTMPSLGAWKQHENAPPQDGSNAYATAFTTFVLERSGIASDARVAHALEWLRAHQDAEGSWTAVSMNKPYKPGSMQIRFMQDAATAYAVLALTSR